MKRSLSDLLDLAFALLAALAGLAVLLLVYFGPMLVLAWVHREGVRQVSLRCRRPVG